MTFKEYVLSLPVTDNSTGDMVKDMLRATDFPDDVNSIEALFRVILKYRHRELGQSAYRSERDRTLFSSLYPQDMARANEVIGLVWMTYQMRVDCYLKAVIVDPNLRSRAIN